MKKVKIMLFAVLALAVGGGALAFKAKSETAFCFYSANVSGGCTTFTKIPPNVITTITELAGDFNAIQLLQDIDDPCPEKNCTTRLTLIEEGQ